MKICIFGIGAIGGLVAARLSEAGHDVTCIARGSTLVQLQSDGLTLEVDGQSRSIPIHATDQPSNIGLQDFVLLTTKAHHLPAAAGALHELAAADTRFVTMHNGIPWWYFFRHGGVLQDTHLNSVDLGGVLWHAIGPSRAIGAVVLPAARVKRPGVVAHIAGNGFIFGSVDQAQDADVADLVTTFKDAGFDAGHSVNIRRDIWWKLTSNAGVNGLSALTGLTIGDLLDHRPHRKKLQALIEETMAVADRLGCRPDLEPSAIIEALAVVGNHKTSMLQDLEAGKDLEIDPIIGAVVEIGTLLEVDVPHMVSLFAELGVSE